MDVYAPANQPLVICAGDEQDTSGLRSALRGLLGGFGLLAFASLLVQQLFGQGVSAIFGPDVESSSAGTTSPDVSYLPNSSSSPSNYPDLSQRTVTETAPEAAGAAQTAAASVLPPGAAFFAGGAVVLLGLFVIWYVGQ